MFAQAQWIGVRKRCGGNALASAAAVCFAVSAGVAARAQPPSQTPSPDTDRAPAAGPSIDLQTQAVLLGAAYAHSDLSDSRGGGMMFLPGRGLIRWETAGKTPEQQEEARIEAIGLADARAVQAAIDARAAQQEADRQRELEATAIRDEARLRADARAAGILRMDGITGTRREAGGIAPLNRGARQAVLAALGVKEGSTFKSRNRLYLFGAVSGRGVGMNLLHDDHAGWTNAGLSTDTGGFIGQRQAGLAWRSGSAQTALSYVQEKTWSHILGVTAVKDHRAMVNFSITAEPPKAIPHPDR